MEGGSVKDNRFDLLEAVFLWPVYMPRAGKAVLRATTLAGKAVAAGVRKVYELSDEIERRGLKNIVLHGKIGSGIRADVFQPYDRRL
ncbi:hypothetical protein [Thermococcus sp. LS2]|uniref:hypothetical protein n=1 Tax=Thermococcus sp. LS2 TaxID=1638260 RepID=UPI0014393119|nr:hypothetical protein [Thermococcus sp. LS2]NJE13759.1 hypothetical protein [Thermococcus sp. LS2]